MLDLASRPSADLGRPLDGQGAALIFEKPSRAPATRWRWPSSSSAATRSTPAATRSASTCASRSRTSCGSSQGYHAVLAARVFHHEVLERMVDGRRRAGRQHALRPVPPAAGAGRRADDGAGARPAGRADRGLGRRLQQRRPLARRGLRPARCPRPLRLPGRLRAPTTPSWSGWRCSARPASARRHRPAEAVAGADAVHADTWVSMGQEADKAGAQAGVRGLHRRRRADGAGRAGGRLHALPAGLPRSWRSRPT